MARRLLPLLTALLLAACQRTVFEHPPAAAAACDPALVGRWLSQGERKEPDGEVEAHISANCHLQIIEQRREGERRSDPTRLGVSASQRPNLLWVDAGWAHRSFDVEPGPLDREGDVYVYAYRIQRGGRLQLLPVRHRELAQSALAGKLKADVLYEGGSLTVRVPGDGDARDTLLRQQRLFDRSQVLRFRRASQEP